MGRACECCDGACQTGNSRFDVDRYESINAFSFYTVTEEYYKVVLLKDLYGLTKKKLSSTKIDSMTKVENGKDGSLVAMLGFRTEPYKSDSLEEIVERDLGEEYDPYDYKFTTYYKKTTVERKIAVEFSIDDVYDWGSEFIKDVFFHHLYTDPVNRPGGNAPAYDRYTVADFLDNPLRGYEIYGGIVDKPFPQNINQVNNYILEFGVPKVYYTSSVSTITDDIPQENGKFLLIINHLGRFSNVDLKDPITDSPEDETTGITDNPQGLEMYDSTAAVFCFDYDSESSGKFLKMFVDVSRGGPPSTPESDWHNNFTREAEGVYVSKASFLNSLIDMTDITSPYFAYGGKLNVEIYSPKSGNKKTSAKETYFHETFRYEPESHSFEIEAKYSHDCQYSQEYGTLTDKLKITNPVTILDEKYFDIIKEAPEYVDPFDDPPNGEYWVHELRLKQKYLDTFADPVAVQPIYSEYDDDPCDPPPLFYSYWEYPYKWRAVYGDNSSPLTMAIYQSKYEDNNALYQKTICTDEDPYGCYQYTAFNYNNLSVGFPCLGHNLRMFYNSAGSCATNNTSIHFRIWDCVLETPGAFTGPESTVTRLGLPEEPRYKSTEPKIYYKRVPYYGKYKPSKIKLTFLDFKNYEISVQTQEVYNPYTGDNEDCPRVDCLLGPNIPDWQLVSEDFDSAGEPTSHDLIFHGLDSNQTTGLSYTSGYAGCSTKIISKKKEHKVGSIKISLNYSRVEGVYSPTAEKIYVLQSEVLDRGYAPGERGGSTVVADGFTNLGPRMSAFRPVFEWNECVPTFWTDPSSTFYDVFEYTFGTGPSEIYPYFGVDSYTHFYGAGPSIPERIDPESGLECCALVGFGQGGHWIRFNVGGWNKTVDDPSCKNYVSASAGSVLVANVEDLTYISEHRYAEFDKTYVEVELDNNFASTHTISVQEEPYVTVDDFAAFALASKQREEEGVVELVLGIGYERYSNNEFVDYYGDSTTYRGVSLPEDQLYRADIYISGSRDSFRAPLYMPGAGLRFRMSDETFSFSVFSSFTSSDFDILHQEYIPVIIQDEQLSQEEIDEIAGYLIDFDYQYRISGKVFIENPDSENFKEVDGQKIYGDFFESPYFSIAPNGSVSDPYAEPKPLVQKFRVAVYDEVDITIDGSHKSQYVIAVSEQNCPLEYIDTDEESLDCFWARGVNGLIRDGDPLRDDYSIIDVYDPGTPNVNEYRYKNTRDTTNVDTFSIPAYFKTDMKVSSPSRTLVSWGALRNLGNPYMCPTQDYDVERLINDGFYTEPGQVARFSVDITVPPPVNAPGNRTTYSLRKADGTFVDGVILPGEDSVAFADYGSYRNSPSNKFDNQYIKNSEQTIKESATTEWRDFPIASSVISAKYKKTVNSDKCGRFLNLDFSDKDRTIANGFNSGDEERFSNFYIQRKVSLWKKNVEDLIWESYYSGGYDKKKVNEIINIEEDEINQDYVVDGYLRPEYMIIYLNYWINYVDHNFTTWGTQHGPRTLPEFTFGVHQRDRYQSYRDLTYTPDYTYRKAVDEISSKKNRLLLSFLPEGFVYSLMSSQTGKPFLYGSPRAYLNRGIQSPIYSLLQINSNNATLSEDGRNISIPHADMVGKEMDMNSVLYIIVNGEYRGPYEITKYRDTPVPTLTIDGVITGCEVSEQEYWTIEIHRLSPDPKVDYDACPPEPLSSPYIRKLHQISSDNPTAIRCNPYDGNHLNLLPIERTDTYEKISIEDYEFTLVKGSTI